MTYDANGNLQYSSYDGVNLYREYNALNQLKFVRNGTNSSAPILEEFIFHPVEERTWIKKVYNSSGNVTETTYYLSKEFVMVVNSSGTYNYTFIYLDDKIVAQVNPDNSVYYLLGDLKGSTVVTTNSSGTVLENTTYTDFGNVISGGTKSKRGYESKEYDSLTKSLDFNFRRINPVAPVWEQPDTILPNVYDPQELNRYMFERGNPYKYTDSSGHFVASIFGTGMGSVIGGTLAVVAGLSVGAPLAIVAGGLALIGGAAIAIYGIVQTKDSPESQLVAQMGINPVLGSVPALTKKEGDSVEDVLDKTKKFNTVQDLTFLAVDGVPKNTIGWISAGYTVASSAQNIVRTIQGTIVKTGSGLADLIKNIKNRYETRKNSKDSENQPAPRPAPTTYKKNT